MENNNGLNKISEYVDQHIAIVTFLAKEHKKLIEIMLNDPTDGIVILKFLNKLEELEPFVNKYGDIISKGGEDMYNIMEPIDALKMMGKLADIFDISDAIMGIYLKHTAKGGNNE